jgi:mRNA interferase MazF
MRSKRGDVVLVLFPNSNLTTAKRRLALVVQAENLKTGLDQSIVAMITSNPARADHPSRIAISISSPEGRQSGLKIDSIVMTDNLATILDNEIDRVIGTYIGTRTLDAALRHTLGL